ncbi:MAG: alpha/beta fold hydrolase [Candidatus Dormiibacterota bacterium]
MSSRIPLLFVHGMWIGPWCWEEHFAPWFRDHGYTVETVALRRHDQRHSPGLRTTRIREYVDDVIAAAEKMPSPPVVIGHSMGGFVTQLYLQQHTAPAAVLVASVPPRGILAPTFRTAARHPLRLAAAGATMSLYRNVSTPRRARETFFSPGLSDELVRQYQARMTDESFFALIDMMFFVRPRIEEVKRTPLLVLGADRDSGISRAEVAATAKAYEAELETFPGAHALMLEPGWAKVAERIDTFVRSKVGAATG